MAVLDTSALLSWPIERCREQIVSILQQTELLNVDEQRWLLIDSLDMDWRTASPEERNVVHELASKTVICHDYRMWILISSLLPSRIKQHW